MKSNGREHRIYTSTPKNEFSWQRQSQERNNDIGCCSLAKAKSKQYICAIVGSLIIITMPYINGNNIQQLSSYVQAQLSIALDWTEHFQLAAKLIPVLCGLVVGGFCYAIVYLDSDIPGINPPAPFSPRSKQRYRQESAGLHINYTCALAVGAMVAAMLYMDLWGNFSKISFQSNHQQY